MKPFDAATLAALGNRRASKRNMIRLDLVEGTYGFWNGSGDFTYDGVSYKGAGKYLQFAQLGGAADLSVSPIEVKLSSIPDSALTPDVLGSVFSYTWHQRPATLYDAYFHPDTGALIMVERIARRRLDVMPMKEKVGGEAVLVATLQPLNFDNPSRGFLRYNDPDQRLIDAADGFFKFAALAGSQQISWGRIASQPGIGGAGTTPRQGG